MSYMLTSMIENSKQHTLHHHIMVCLKWRFHNTWTFVQNSCLKVCCTSFWIFLMVAKDLAFVSLLLQHDCSERTEEWKLNFVRKCLGRKWGIKSGKMNQALQLACFFKMQKMIGCGKTTKPVPPDSLPPLGHRHMYTWKWPFHYFIYIFGHNDFIMGIIA